MQIVKTQKIEWEDVGSNTGKKCYFRAPVYNQDINNLIKEKKANIFAGELLIPKDVLTELIGESKYVAQSVVPQLCDLFMVSKNVMVERLKCLGIKVFE